MARLENLRDVRYGELLFLYVKDGEAYADVWNTMGFNDCPAGPFDAIDAEAEAAKRGALFCMKNGPRYWTFDALEAGMRETAAVETFGELQMFLAATVSFGDTPPQQLAYVERYVARDNFWEYRAGQPRYYLTRPDGARYVLQAYALYVDPTQTVASLKDLGDRLGLPEGWRFDFEPTPATTLRVGTGADSVAAVLQDELGNTYQLMKDVEELSA